MEYPEVAAVDNYRLAHDCTFQQLVDRIGSTGVTISYKTLYNTLRLRHAPRDRTIYKLRHFLNAIGTPVQPAA